MKIVAHSILAFALSSSLYAEAPKQFAPKWIAGKTYHNKTHTETVSTIPGQGEMTNIMDMDVKAVAKAGTAPDTVDVEMTYEKMDMKAKMGAMDVPMGAAASAIVGKTITMTYGADGQPKDVKGFEALMGDPTAAQFMNPDALKKTFSSAMMGFPDKEVAAGDSWPFKIDMPNPMMSMTIQGTYTYVKDEELEGHKCAVIKMDGSMSMKVAAKEGDAKDPAAAAMSAMAMEMKDSTMSGTIYYDFDLGNVRKSDTVTSMNMSITNPADGKKMEMPSKTKATTTLTAE
jgi:hypothetical protein